MDLSLVGGNALEANVDLLVLTTFGDAAKDANVKALSAALDGVLLECAASESFDGKANQVLAVPTAKRLPARRVLVVGLGPKAEVEANQLRDAMATALAHAAKVGAVRVAVVLPALNAKQEPRKLQWAAEGIYLGAYKFDRYLTSDDARRKSPVKTVEFYTEFKGKKLAAAEVKAGALALQRAAAIGEAVNHARDMVNEPAAVMTPTAIAARAEAIAAKHKSVTVRILDREECAAKGMGMFLAVAQGSDEEPRFVHMTYKPAKKAKKRIALIGKGLTFDSGGYSIKPSSSMETMKVDMAGSAAVISAMDAIATLGCEHEVHVVAACCENMVSGRAYRLGDVLHSMDGLTVEINNTDAEGRLTLGDAITYTRKEIAPDEMFDFATLTGACMVALGPHTAGVLSDHEALLKHWMDAAAHAGEDMWRLPLNPRLRDQLKSPIADMRNTGDRMGGAITAGLFLKAFAKDTPWVHVDIAGPADTTSGRPSVPKGGTGFAVASIIEYLTA